jgi:hypothetical protein
MTTELEKRVEALERELASVKERAAITDAILKPCPFCGAKAILRSREHPLLGSRLFHIISCSADCCSQTAERENLLSRG